MTKATEPENGPTADEQRRESEVAELVEGVDPALVAAMDAVDEREQVYFSVVGSETGAPTTSFTTSETS